MRMLYLMCYQGSNGGMVSKVEESDLVRVTLQDWIQTKKKPVTISIPNWETPIRKARDEDRSWPLQRISFDDAEMKGKYITQDSQASFLADLCTEGDNTKAAGRQTLFESGFTIRTRITMINGREQVLTVPVPVIMDTQSDQCLYVVSSRSFEAYTSSEAFQENLLFAGCGCMQKDYRFIYAQYETAAGAHRNSERAWFCFHWHHGPTLHRWTSIHRPLARYCNCWPRWWRGGGSGIRAQMGIGTCRRRGDSAVPDRICHGANATSLWFESHVDSIHDSNYCVHRSSQPFWPVSAKAGQHHLQACPRLSALNDTRHGNVTLMAPRKWNVHSTAVFAPLTISTLRRTGSSMTGSHQHLREHMLLW